VYRAVVLWNDSIAANTDVISSRFAPVATVSPNAPAICANGTPAAGSRVASTTRSEPTATVTAQAVTA
jgi:hypothetical protein